MEPNLIAVVALGVAVLGYMASHYRTKSVADLDNRLGKLETKVDLYFDFQEKYNAQILHRDDDRDKVDELLEKREQLEPLPADSKERLDRTLEAIINDKNEVIGRRAAAAQMLAARKAREMECS